MANSSTLTIRDFTTGAGRTGLTVKLRHKDDNFASDVYTATEVAGKPGVYEFTDVPMNKYKVWINGNEDKSFGGDNGKWFPTDDLLAYLLTNLVLDAGNITTGKFAAARIPDLPASIITSGEFSQERLPFVLSQKSNMLIVDSSLAADIAGRAYQTVQGAINYAQSQAPTALSQWFILIMPGKTKAYNENITLQPYVHLQGFYGFAVIAGSLSGINVNSRLVKIFHKYAGNETLQNLIAVDCIFQLTDTESGFTLTVNTCKLLNVGLVSGGGAAVPRVISAGNNIFAGACWANTAFELAETDKGVVSSLLDNDFQFSY